MKVQSAPIIPLKMEGSKGIENKGSCIKIWLETGVDNTKISMVAQGRNNKFLIVTGSLYS